MATINQILRNKVTAINDYTSEPLVLSEIEELALVINDVTSPVEERILAAKVMVNVCENRLQRAKNQVAHFQRIYSQLVHENEKEKAKTSLINEVSDKLGKQEGLEGVLQAMLDRVRANKGL